MKTPTCIALILCCIAHCPLQAAPPSPEETQRTPAPKETITRLDSAYKTAKQGPPGLDVFFPESPISGAAYPVVLSTHGESAGGPTARTWLPSPADSFPRDPALADAERHLAAGVKWYGPRDFLKTPLFSPDGCADFRGGFGSRGAWVGEDAKKKGRTSDKAPIERETRDISGWKVHVAKKLLETEADDTARALAGLKKMLDAIVRDVPAPAVAELKKVPLYFSPAYKPGQSGAEFHPGAGWLRENGRDPVMVRGVEFSGVHDFEAEMRRMPNFALHELAHAFHHRVLPEGFDNAEIKAAFERAKSRGGYERVERTRGDSKPNTHERAYGMTNAMEFFAETTEAYFARNDFFPFNRDELQRHDPEMHALLAKLWGVPAVHQAPDSTQWLSYPGGDGPGKGKRIVLIAADQEYRSEQSMPMLAKILSTHHGFDCTVLFGVNERGEVDPTLPVYPEKGKEAEFKVHHIPGLEHLASADLVIFFNRLLTLPQSELEQIVKYVDSGKPIIALRTANHGFRGPLPYKIDGKQVRWGEDILGGSFMNHHGRWQADSTRGAFDKEQLRHPILTGVADIWGDSDVYRTYKEGASLPKGCTALVWGQPLLGRKPDDRPNDKLEPLPVAWVKPWRTSGGQTARVFHSTMGSGIDLKNPGLRRLLINAVYWGIGLESSISATRSVEIVGGYQPLESGFNYDKLGVKPRAVSFYR